MSKISQLWNQRLRPYLNGKMNRLCELIAHICRRSWRAIRRHRNRSILIAALLLLGVRSILWYGEYEASQLEVTHSVLPASALPGSGPLRIALLADIHDDREILEKSIEELKLAKPNLIIIGGDIVLVSQRFMRSRRLIGELRELKDIAPCYAVLGNQDYEKQSEAERVYASAGIPLLRNNATDWTAPNGKAIRIIGLGDINEGDEKPEACMPLRHSRSLMPTQRGSAPIVPQEDNSGLILSKNSIKPQEQAPDIAAAQAEAAANAANAAAAAANAAQAAYNAAAAANAANGKSDDSAGIVNISSDRALLETDNPVLLISHDPESRHLLKDYRWNLMLSGHTHGGQLGLPFTNPRHCFSFRSDAAAGHYLVAPDASLLPREASTYAAQRCIQHLYVSRGLGSIYGLRYFCRPELSIIDILPED